jgi:selT/selW/selH-like putative selenoprotein
VVRGSGGIFKVTANDQLLFDKHAAGRFPSEKEILEKLRAMAT